MPALEENTFFPRLDIAEGKSITDYENTWNEILGTTFSSRELAFLLNESAAKGKKNNIEKIISTQKDPDFKVKLSSNNWGQALLFAVKNNRIDIVEALRDYDQITITYLQLALKNAIDSKVENITEILDLLFSFNIAKSKPNECYAYALNDAIQSIDNKDSTQHEVHRVKFLLDYPVIKTLNNIELGQSLIESVSLSNSFKALPIVEKIIDLDKSRNSSSFFSIGKSKKYITTEALTTALQKAYNNGYGDIFKTILNHPNALNIPKEALSKIYEAKDENINIAENQVDIRKMLQKHIETIESQTFSKRISFGIRVAKILAVPILDLICSWKSAIVGGVAFADKLKTNIIPPKAWNELVKFTKPLTHIIELGANKLINNIPLLSVETQNLAKKFVKTSAPIVVGIALVRAIITLCKHDFKNLGFKEALKNSAIEFTKTIAEAGISVAGATIGTVAAEAAIGAGIVGATTAAAIPLLTAGLALCVIPAIAESAAGKVRQIYGKYTKKIVEAPLPEGKTV